MRRTRSASSCRRSRAGLIRGRGRRIRAPFGTSSRAGGACVSASSDGIHFRRPRVSRWRDTRAIALDRRFEPDSRRHREIGVVVTTVDLVSSHVIRFPQRDVYGGPDTVPTAGRVLTVGWTLRRSKTEKHRFRIDVFAMGCCERSGVRASRGDVWPRPRNGVWSGGRILRRSQVEVLGLSNGRRAAQGQRRTEERSGLPSMLRHVTWRRPTGFGGAFSRDVANALRGGTAVLTIERVPRTGQSPDLRARSGRRGVTVRLAPGQKQIRN